MMKRPSPFFLFIFLTVFLQNFTDKFVWAAPPSPSADWHLTNPWENVPKFGQFINAIYTECYQTVQNKSANQKNIIFNLTFVKFASEIATFRVIKKAKFGKVGVGEKVPNWKINQESEHIDKFIGFMNYDETMGQHFANAYDKNVFSPIAKKIVAQILQLTFSFAIRILLSVMYKNYFRDFQYVGQWQLDTLLSAFKILTNQRGTNENGIFPFQIIKIDSNNAKHFWTEMKSENGTSAEQKRYIENFKFILKLSEFTLSYYDVYNLLETIRTKSETIDNISTIDSDALPNDDDASQQHHEFYTFMAQHFNDKFSSSNAESETTQSLTDQFSYSSDELDSDDEEIEEFHKKIKEKRHKIDCAFANLGTVLLQRMEYPIASRLSDFKKFAEKAEKICRANAHRNFEWFRKTITDDNTPALKCFRLEIELFQEPIWNYANVVGIELNKCRDVVKFGKRLNKIVKNYHSAKNITEVVEFKILHAVFLRTDAESLTKMEEYSKKRNKKLNSEQTDEFLSEFLSILDQIEEKYKSNDLCQLGKINPFLENYYKQKIKFSQILFETLSKYSDNVKYDEKRQLLSFPLAMGEHIIKRLIALISQSANYCIDEIDFEKTIQNIVSDDQLHFHRKQQQKNYHGYDQQNFQFLFILAIRLCEQIGHNDFVDKHSLNVLLAAFPRDYNRYEYFFFGFKIQIANENLIEINSPTWLVPYYVYVENKKELEQKGANENFDFLLTLSKLPPTLYEVIKMVDILEKMDEDGNILFNSSDPKSFIFVLKFLTKSEMPIAEQTKLAIPQNYFCILAHFVEELLDNAMLSADYLPLYKIQSFDMAIQNFVEKKEKLCAGESIKNAINEHFGESIVNFVNATAISDKVMEQILPELLAELEKMIKNENWHYANLNYLKIIEWNLLEIELNKSGRKGKWEKIEKVRKEWEKIFNETFFDEKKKKSANFKKIAEKLKKNLENLTKASEEQSANYGR